jgi:uncharacterized low-complexity protein
VIIVMKNKFLLAASAALLVTGLPLVACASDAGAKKDDDSAKAAEGSCGGDKAAADGEAKPAEGSCGGDKGEEGSCGGR